LWLLEKGADPNARSQTGDSVLHWLSCSIVSVEEYGNCLELLMEYGANPHVTDGEGRSVLDVLIEHNAQLPELQDLLHQAVVGYDARSLQVALSGTDVEPPKRERL
jgi:ankyrin repeat protein